MNDGTKIILLALFSGAIAGGAIGFFTASVSSDAPTADAAGSAVVARLDDIAERLKSIHSDLAARPTARDVDAGPSSGASNASDPRVVETLDAVREELKQNTAAVGALAARTGVGESGAPTIAGAHPDLDAKAVEAVQVAMAMKGPARSAMQRKFLLKTPQEVVAELGRPSWINWSRTDPGVTWVYDSNSDGTPDFTVQMHSGYVVRIDP